MTMDEEVAALAEQLRLAKDEIGALRSEGPIVRAVRTDASIAAREHRLARRWEETGHQWAPGVNETAARLAAERDGALMAWLAAGYCTARDLAIAEARA